MGYTLQPINKKIKSVSFGSFFWPIMLQECGMGYVIGYGAGRRVGSYVYQSGNNGSPVSNDGYKVNSTQAKAMASVARGYVTVQRFINKEWAGIPENEKPQAIDMKIYRSEASEEYIKKFEMFADFAEQSKGFTIK